ncbi:EAL domain-containing protein [Aquibacillus halophilus]|uniref:EAL domain-containing protein n=1 Tax=Aquibacillus halophilus TaxID=930132 RepID=A0A6A8D659_9BACI|nr:bifunctional diguanylate cyclase/phosphodiesterase [Aquibacillus halophilus]MRH41094.1 EAL domain-containing protein [Aquibacillus halophilus]
MNQNNFISNFESLIGLSDFLSTIDAMGVGLSIVDASLDDLPLVYVNEGFVEMTGYKKEEVLMKNCRFLQGPETDEKQVNKIKKAIKEYKAETVTLKNYHKDGSYFWNQFIISPIFGDDDKVLYYIGLQFDITKQVEEEKGNKQKITELSNFDQITGLMKLGFFTETIQTYKDSPEQGAIIRINLNRFRNINNSYGELVSDGVLVEIANRLRQIFPSSPIARSFADDFIVYHSLANSLELKNALLAVESALKRPYLLLGEEVTIDFSIGISQYPQDGNDIEQLLSYAALALREAKNETMVNYCFFNGELATRLKTRMSIEKNLVKGLENNEFIINYQPKVSAATSEVVGMEALIRWRDSDQKIISPADFIPIAEETGFIIELGEWILFEACKTNKQWQDKGLSHVPVSVNVSALQFMHPHFTQTVQKVLADTGLAANYLELEVTESILINQTIIVEKLHELKSIGVLISIDDFGTGYSSINYLKNFPIDTLKIDRAFVMDTPSSERDNALLLSIIQLGKSLGLSVLAEGVELEEQVHFLSNGGCDYIQGFYFSRPLDEKTMEEQLK